MKRVILYSGTKNASSWAMRAWLALRASGIEFEERVVDIRRPQRFPNLAEVGRISPPAMVPVLVVDEVVIYDSLAIMEFANDLGGGKLLPGDPLTRARARSIVAWQHSGLSNICARISFESAFYPFKRALTSTEAEECSRLVSTLSGLLLESGGPFLFGPLSMADLALVPAIVRLSRHGLDLSSWSLVRSWMSTLLEHEHVSEWLESADQLPHVWLEDYLDLHHAAELSPDPRYGVANQSAV